MINCNITPTNPIAPAILNFDATTSVRDDNKNIYEILYVFEDGNIQVGTASKQFNYSGPFWVDVLLVTDENAEDEVKRFWFIVNAQPESSVTNPTLDSGTIAPTLSSVNIENYLIFQYNFTTNSQFDFPSNLGDPFKCVITNTSEVDPVYVTLYSAEYFLDENNNNSNDYEFLLQPLDVKEIIGKFTSGKIDYYSVDMEIKVNIDGYGTKQ